MCAVSNSPAALPFAAAPGPAARRDLLLAGAALAMAGLAPARAVPARWVLPYPEIWRRPRLLWITRPQAQEAVRAVYWADGALQPEGYGAFNRLYRDLYANVQHPIALGLLDLNFVMQAALWRAVGPRPLVLFSGYRTHASNVRVGGVEPNIHGLGMADDFHYEGLSLQENLRLARQFQVGGLGLYPDRGSLHKDIGRFRSWVTAGRPALSRRVAR